MKLLKINLLSLSLLTLSFSSWALESYQGIDYPLKSWMCGAPLVETLRSYDPDNLLNDSAGKLSFKESLIQISESNLRYLRKKLGTLSEQEKQLLELIEQKYPAPIVHRASVDTSRLILNAQKMESATKRGAKPTSTPMIEQHLFAGHDCIFTSVASPFGIMDYGTVIFRFEPKKGFAWGSMYTGFRWALEVEKKEYTAVPGEGMKRRFARQIFTNNHWNEVLGLLIIENVRAGTSFRGRGAPYDKTTILDRLLSESSQLSFWELVVRHRLAFFEGHFTDNIPLDHIDYVQYRSLDKPIVSSWGISRSWLQGEDPFIQFYNRLK